MDIGCMVFKMFSESLPDEYVRVYVDGDGIKCEWFNPITDAILVLSIVIRLVIELRDHDGQGCNLMPWYWDDLMADPDTSNEDIVRQAVDIFVGHVVRTLDKYNSVVLM